MCLVYVSNRPNMVMLRSDKIDFKAMTVTRDKARHFFFNDEGVSLSSIFNNSKCVCT